MMGKGKAKIYDSDGKPVADIHAKAAKYMLDSYSRDFEPEYKTIVKQKPNFSKPARTLSVRAKNLIKACENYSKWYPKDKKTVKTCDTFITEIYYRSNDKKMALRYLWLIATKYPESKEGVEAVENLIPLYKEDKKGLSIAVNKLLAIPSYQKGKIGKKLTALRRAAAIEAIASEKDKIKRAELYEKRAKQNPRDKDAPKFWNNAAVDYLAGGAAFKAIGAYVNLVKLYPSSELSKDAMLELGKLYDRRLDFNASANYYLTYAAKNPKAKESSGAIQRACDLQIAIGSSNAVQTCSRLIKTYPENAKEAFGHLVDNFWRAQKYSDMTNLINEVYLRRFKLSINERIISNYKIYKAYGGRGNAAEQAGKRIEALLRSSSKASGEALRYIGEIAFKKANVYLAPYLKESLRGGTVENMLASIKKKTASLERLEKAYGQVLNTKDSYWGIAAYHQIGFAYEQFTSLLKNPPAIKGAKISDVQKELSGSAAQAQKKAVDYYTAGLDIARKLSVYNEWPAKLKTSLARLQGKTVSFADWVITPDFVGSEVPEDVSSEVWVGR
ncbi:MAG: hypothetical protein R3B45_06865 [Bdellovibrionota bacterium]